MNHVLRNNSVIFDCSSTTNEHISQKQVLDINGNAQKELEFVGNAKHSLFEICKMRERP